MGIKINEVHKYKNDASEVAIIDKLCETICTKYDIPNIDELRSVIQNEVSTTVTQFVSRNLTSQSDFDNKVDPDNPGRFIVNVPLNSCVELSRAIRKSPTRSVVIVVGSTGNVYEPVLTGDTEGDRFLNTIAKPIQLGTTIGTVSRDQSGQWQVVISEDLPSAYVDLDLYSRCWGRCSNDNYVRDFINDIYSRINGVGKYTKGGSRYLGLGESIDYASDLSEIEYMVEFDPDKILQFIEDNELNESDDSDDSDKDKNDIQDFFEAIFNIPDGRGTTIEFTPSKLSKFLFKTGAKYVVGKTAMDILNKVGAKIVPPVNPYTPDVKSKYR